MHMIRLAAIATSLAAVPAVATLSAPVAGYRLDVGNFPGVHANGNTVGAYGLTSARGSVSLVTSLSPVPLVNAHASNGNLSSVASASGYLDYNYLASFTAPTGFGGVGGAPVRLAGLVQLTASANAQSFASVAGTFYACYGDSPSLSNACGQTHFTQLVTGDLVSATDLGGGRARYTFTGGIDLGVDATAFENYTGAHGLRYTASAFVDPVVDFDPAYLAGIGADSPDIQLSPGVANASGPPPAVGGVPEPTSWALLIAGFGLSGAMARRGRMRIVAA